MFPARGSLRGRFSFHRHPDLFPLYRRGVPQFPLSVGESFPFFKRPTGWPRNRPFSPSIFSPSSFFFFTLERRLLFSSSHRWPFCPARLSAALTLPRGSRFPAWSLFSIRGTVFIPPFSSWFYYVCHFSDVRCSPCSKACHPIFFPGAPTPKFALSYSFLLVYQIVVCVRVRLTGFSTLTSCNLGCLF